MDSDLETMDSVHVGPVGQASGPDHIVFGHTGAGNKLAKGMVYVWFGLSVRFSFGSGFSISLLSDHSLQPCASSFTFRLK